MDHMNRAWVEDSLVPHTEGEVAGGVLVQDRRIVNDRVIKDITWTAPKATPRRFVESVRMYWPEELVEILDRHGLTVEARWGSFNGAELCRNSRRMILVARKEAQ